jgi:hypothetical protein
MKIKSILVATAISFILFKLSAVPAAVFHAEFDRDFRALSSQGGIAGKHSQEILWETLAAYLRKGVSGKAAIIGTGDDGKQDYHIEYLNKAFITQKEGSVAFWVNPVDWRPNDKKFHIFFRAMGKDADLLIYKGLWSPEISFLIGPQHKENGRHVWTIAKASIKDWKVGKWYFIVATWGNGKASLYVNGIRKAQANYKKVPVANFTKFGVGGLMPQKWKTPQNLSLIDDLMLYSKPLTTKNVRARYTSYGYGFLPKDDDAPVVPQKIFTMGIPKTGEFKVNFVVPYTELDGTPYKVKAVVRAGNREIFTKTITSENAMRQLTVPAGTLKPGDYSLVLQVLNSDGAVKGSAKQSFTIPKVPEVWANNTIGEEDEVPSPWTPPKWNAVNGTFSCWNREYIFGKSSLPEQIVSGGRKLLAAPVTLSLDGAPLKFNKLTVLLQKNEAIKLASNSTTGKFKIKATVKGEFDGFLWFDIVITPRGRQNIRSLTLDIPFLKSASTLFNSMTKQYYTYKSGDAGKIKNYAMDLYLKPRIMSISNDDVGLEWFCEELSDWYNRSPQKSLQIITGKERNILQLNLIDYPCTINRKLCYRFGIQGLPVKPLPRQWRLLRAKGENKNSFQPWFPWEILHNIPDPRLAKQNYQKSLNKEHQKAPKVLHYFAGFTNSPYTKEWSYYGGIWSKTPPALGHYGSLQKREWAFAWNCPAARSYRDYYLYGLANTIDKLNIQHLYFDNQDAQLCSNSLHGCGWRGTDGNTYKTYNLLATRDLVKRIYKMFKKKRPNGLIMRHMSAKTVTPVIGFADILADGEIYNGTIAIDESYKNIFTSEMYRAMFRSSPYGIPRYFIPQFQRAIKSHSPIPKRYEKAWKKTKDLLKQRDKLRHFKGYCLVHDSLIWPAFGITLNDWWKIQERFGMNGEESFIMYNSPASPFKTAKGVMASCYILNGKMLIVVMNESKSSNVQIKLLAEKLKAKGVSIKRVINVENNQKSLVINNTINCKIPEHDYLIFLVE